jgi:hypothetical protein
MPTINQLPLLPQATGGDQLAVYNTVNGDARRLSLNSLLQFFQANFAAPTFATQFATPGTGFNIAITAVGNVWLLLQPAGGLATGTVTLPLASGVADGTEIMVTTTQQIASLSVGLNGATAQYGWPTSLAANDFAKMRFYEAGNSWYRVG